MCSVGLNFNLSAGVVANAMSKAAGPALQMDLSEKTEEAAILGERDIIHTVPGNLPCRYVIHCVCCPWKGGAEQEQVGMNEPKFRLQASYCNKDCIKLKL